MIFLFLDYFLEFTTGKIACQKLTDGRIIMKYIILPPKIKLNAINSPNYSSIFNKNFPQPFCFQVPELLRLHIYHQAVTRKDNQKRSAPQPESTNVEQYHENDLSI